jgi:hypothetical protein
MASWKPCHFICRLLFIISLNLCLNNTVIGQVDVLQVRVKLENRKTTVRRLMKEVLPNAGIELSYSDKFIPFGKKIEFNQHRPKIYTILSNICRNNDLAYNINGNEVQFRYYDRPDSDFEFVISGRVRDKFTGELLVGANISVLGTQIGVITNDYGYFSITLPKGDHEIAVSYLGYGAIIQTLFLEKHMKFDYQLKSKSYELKDILVEGKEEIDVPLENVMSGVNKLNMDVVGDIPYFLGEVDVFQGALLLPGILNVGEGALGVNVRGGSADQNLILMDETIVYNAHHLFGLISVFNPDAVKDVQIFKGSYPSKYGSRNSSVMHVRHKDGNSKEFQASGGIGLITSRLLIEGPIKKDTSSFLIAARSTFWDLITREANNPTIRDSRANFQDLNAKVSYNINDKNRLYLAGYVGADENKFGLDVLRKWGNRMASIRWNKIHSDRLFYNTTLSISRYRYRVLDQDEEENSVGTSKIIDYTLKSDFTYFFKPNNLIEYGLSLIYHQLSPGNRNQVISGVNKVIDIETEQALEADLYLANERNISKKLKMSLGLRASLFSKRGPGTVFKYQQGVVKSIESIIDTLIYNNDESIQNYFNLQPRVSLNYQLSSKASLKLNYLNSVQYLHLLSNTLSPTSSDIWKLSDNYISPSVTNQLSIGYYKTINKQKFQFSAEIFYKYNDKIVDYKNGADLLFNSAVEKELLIGNSRAYGLELFVKKDIGNLSGWIGYTLSKSEKRVKGNFIGESINDGKYFPTDFDRTHDFSAAIIYHMNKRWTFSSNFVYYTGRPFSFPDSKYSVDGLIVPHYSNRNLQRLSPYHRLDIAARLEGKSVRKNGIRKKNESYWVFSVYNAYSRKNTQSYFFRENEDNPLDTETIRYSILGFMVPSVTYNFTF